MLELGSNRRRLCDGVSRRSLLQIGSVGLAGGLTWAQARQLAADEPGAARSRSAIVLWLWGGPSQIDLFDPKPRATLDYRGPFEPISTNVPGVQVGELLPKLAKRFDRCALIRSMVSGSNDHGVAGTIGLTGSGSGAIDLGGGVAEGSQRPATGSIVARVRGFDPRRLPPYVILGELLHQGRKRVVGESAGTLGGTYDPFRLTYTPEAGLAIPDTNLPEGMTGDALTARRELLSRLDAPWGGRFSAAPIASMNRHYELALSLLTAGAAREVLALEREPVEVREDYGLTRFGQSCLLARRLVESGIPYVQVNWSTHVEPHEDTGDGGWDMHDRNFQQLQDRHGWILDQAFAALLDDLERRGLLDSTLVVAVGEFGRTPKINVKAGRDHWPNVYSAVLAGAGIRGGTVVGASDKQGAEPAHRPVTPADLGATVLERLGIGVPQLTQLNLLPQGEPIAELV